ncbi:MAG TPA: hypothetical protein VKA60_17175 [Blastocatellia bacterium]|nr:hypothetical protein [Blastocatellia bacterium]
MNNPVRLLLAMLLVALPLAAAAQWNKKPYTEWSEKESMRVLEDSPWSQKQTFTDTSKNASVTTSRGAAQSTIADVVNVTFTMRLFSAKPVRQAISRVMELQRKGEMPDALEKQLKAFAAADFPDYVIVTVTCNGSASNLLQQAQALLQKLKTLDLKNNTYLQTSGGERVFLSEYQAPRNDGFGARFIFPRVVGGKPVLASDSNELLFHAELGNGSTLNGTVPNSDVLTGNTRPNPNLNTDVRSEVAKNGFTLNTRFKVKDMMFDGKLEY